MQITDAERAALRSSSVTIALLFNLRTENPLRFWLGVGKFRPGVTLVDATSETYDGYGLLVDVPALQQLINGAAETVTVSLSGVSQTVQALAAAHSPAVRDRACYMGLAVLGAGWTMLGPVRWPWLYTASMVELEQSRAALDADGKAAPVVRRVGISLASAMIARRRARYSYWSDQDQQARSPGDRFCERTTAMTDTEKQWPRFN